MRLEQLEVLSELGRGGMGVVWRARDRLTGREVAVKQVLVDDPEARARFAQEVSALGRLRHPNLVQVHASGLDPRGLPYLIMELVPGVSLSAKLKDGPLAPRAAAQLLAGAARGIAHAHERGILHRDLKPQNMLLDAATGQAKVLDFGLAVARDSAERLTKTGALLGTPQYMAPEQLGDAKRAVDARTDVYGLGATLYQALTARPPFEAPEAAQIMLKVLLGPPPSPRDSSAEVPEPLDAICLKALASEPGDRYSTATELADDLERWLRGEPTVARPITAAQRRLLRWRRGRGPVVAVGLTLVTLGLAAAGVGAYTTRRDTDALVGWRRALAGRLDAEMARARTAEEARRLVERGGAAAPAALTDEPLLGALAPRVTRSAHRAARAAVYLARARAAADVAVRPGDLELRLRSATEALADLATVASAARDGDPADDPAFAPRARAAFRHRAAGRWPEALTALSTDELPDEVVLAEGLAAAGADGRPRLDEALRVVAGLDHPRAHALRLLGPSPEGPEGADAAAAALVAAGPSAVAALGPRVASRPELVRLALGRGRVGGGPALRTSLAGLALAADRPLLARLVSGELEDEPPGGDLAVVRARAIWSWPLGVVPRPDRLPPGVERKAANLEAWLEERPARVSTAAELAEVEGLAWAGLLGAARDPATSLVGLRDAALLVERLPRTASAPLPPPDGLAASALGRVRAALLPPTPGPWGPAPPAAAAAARRAARVLALVARAEREVEAWQRQGPADALDRAQSCEPEELEHVAELPAWARARGQTSHGPEGVARTRASHAALRALAARLLERAGLPPPPPPAPVAEEGPALRAAWTWVGRIRDRQGPAGLVELPLRRRELVPPGEGAVAAVDSLVAGWLAAIAREESSLPKRGRVAGPSLVAVGQGPGEAGGGPGQRAVLDALARAFAARGVRTAQPGDAAEREADVLLIARELPAEEGRVVVAQRLRVAEQLQTGYAAARYTLLARAVEEAFRGEGVPPGPDGDPIPPTPSGELARGHRWFWTAFSQRVSADTPTILRQLVRAQATGYYLRESIASVVADRWCGLPDLERAVGLAGEDGEAALVRCLARLLVVARLATSSSFEGGRIDRDALEAARLQLDAAVADGDRAALLLPDHPGALVLAASARVARIANLKGALDLDTEADLAVEAVDLVEHAFLPDDAQIPALLLLPSAWDALREVQQADSTTMNGLRYRSWLASNWEKWDTSIEGVFPTLTRISDLVVSITRLRRAEDLGAVERR